MKRYLVTKEFVSGVLKGITIDDPYCPVPFEVGKKYGGGITGDRYIVRACREITDELR